MGPEHRNWKRRYSRTVLLLHLAPTATHAKCLELWDPALCHDANLTLLPQPSTTDAPACLDGSPYGVYFRKSPTMSSKYTMFIQGGGWCYDEHDCLSRSKTDIGSSTKWPSTSGCGCMNVKEDGSIDDACNFFHSKHRREASRLMLTVTGRAARPPESPRVVESYCWDVRSSDRGPVSSPQWP